MPIVSGAGGMDFAGSGMSDRSVYRQNTQHGALRLGLTPTG